MRAVRGIGLTIVLIATALTVACSDVPTAPEEWSPEPSLLLGLDLGIDLDDDGDGGDQVQVVRRTTPLAQDIVVRKTIGPLGGTISLPDAGLTVTVPPLAVFWSRTITVVAPAGDLVGYHFYPAGLDFNVPLVATQDLSGTNAFVLGGLTAAYFEGDLTPTVEALELLPLSIAGLLGSFDIHHFSGYIIATN